MAGLGIAVVAALGGAVAGGGCGGDGGPGGGSQQIGNRVWSAEQTTNAHTIVALAAARGLPKRAAVIAVSTAIVESRLENLGHGDGYGDATGTPTPSGCSSSAPRRAGGPRRRSSTRARRPPPSTTGW